MGLLPLFRYLSHIFTLRRMRMREMLLPFLWKYRIVKRSIAIENSSYKIQQNTTE
jgi:hypothetical protein